MKKFSLKISFMTVCLLTALLALTLTGCGGSAGSDGTQTYAWPLGTSSPEDTVTQIYVAMHTARKMLKNLFLCYRILLY